MKKTNQILFHVIIPMTIGAAVYIIFRSENLLMFTWFDLLGFKYVVDSLRVYFSVYDIPGWLIFNYPDGIWIYSFLSLMLIMWDGIKSNTKFFWFAIAPILGISLEIGQYINIVAGTYDHFDLIFCLAGSLFPFILIKKNNQKNITEKLKY